jgi:hypothetical protein
MKRRPFTSSLQSKSNCFDENASSAIHSSCAFTAAAASDIGKLNLAFLKERRFAGQKVRRHHRENGSPMGLTSQGPHLTFPDGA